MSIGFKTFLVFIGLLIVSITYNIIVDRYKKSKKYLITVIKYYKKDHGREGQMYHDAIKRHGGTYFIKYDGELSKNTGIDSVEIRIVEQ